MEVAPIVVGGLLGVSKLVIHAELENEAVEGGRSEAPDQTHAQLQQQEEELLRHSISIDVSIKCEGSMEIVVQLVCMLIHLRQVGHPVLVVEQFHPVGPPPGQAA